MSNEPSVAAPEEAFLLLRVWFEHDHPRPVRITVSAGAGSGWEKLGAAVSVESAVDLVRSWLDAVVSARRHDPEQERHPKSR